MSIFVSDSSMNDPIHTKIHDKDLTNLSEDPLELSHHLCILIQRDERVSKLDQPVNIVFGIGDIILKILQIYPVFTEDRLKVGKGGYRDSKV